MYQPQLVILAGGQGKRMYPLTKYCPKSLLKIRNGNTILDFQLKQAQQQNIRNIIILTGDKEDMIKKYLLGKRWIHNLTFASSINGTGGSLKSIENLLEENFICQYGDVHININYNSLFNFHKTNSPYLMTMTVHPRRNLQYDPNNVDYDCNRVTFYGKGGCTHRAIDAGVTVLNTKILKDVNAKVWNLSEIIPQLVKQGQVKAFISNNEVFEVGSFEGLEKFKKKMRQK